MPDTTFPIAQLPDILVTEPDDGFDFVQDRQPAAGFGLPASDFSPEQRRLGAYIEYSIETTYEWYEGNLQIPIASADGTPAQEVKTSAVYGTKTIQWSVARIGLVPQMPHWDTQQENEILAYRSIKVYTPILTPGGQTRIFRRAGIYIYHLTLPPSEGDFLPSGAPIPDVMAPAISGVPLSQLNRNVLKSFGVTKTGERLTYTTKS